MDALKAGDKFLLPVEVFELVGWSGDAYAVRVQTVGDDYFKLYPEDVEVLIPANRLTDLEAENARLRAWLKELEPFFDAMICYASTMDEHPPNRIIKEVGDYLSSLNTGDNQ